MLRLSWSWCFLEQKYFHKLTIAYKFSKIKIKIKGNHALCEQTGSIRGPWAGVSTRAITNESILAAQPTCSAHRRFTWGMRQRAVSDQTTTKICWKPSVQHPRCCPSSDFRPPTPDTAPRMGAWTNVPPPPASQPIDQLFDRRPTAKLDYSSRVRLLCCASPQYLLCRVLLGEFCSAESSHYLYHAFDFFQSHEIDRSMPEPRTACLISSFC